MEKRVEVRKMGFEGHKTGGKEGFGRVFRGERNVECVWIGSVE